MIKKILWLIICIGNMLYGVAQDQTVLQSMVLDSMVTAHANAVVRYEKTEVNVSSIQAMSVTHKRIVSVRNKNGNKHVDTYIYYEGNDKSIKKLQAFVYDKYGTLLKKYKKKDFTDRSMYDGFSLQRDDRLKYIDYTPSSYPYTIVFESEIHTTSTAKIEAWFPITDYNLSIEKSIYQIRIPDEMTLRIQENHCEDYTIKAKKEGNITTYTATRLPAITSEYRDGSFMNFVPRVRVAVTPFSLYGKIGTATDWKTFGKWQYDNLIEGRDEVSPKTKAEVATLVANAQTTREKAKRIYEYVQNKTRYISIQLGIGGLQPFKAKEVDRLGYGDCKALTNYTKALLSTQGITSYYAEVYGDRTAVLDIDSEFASLQGNHVILNIPNTEEDIWLECTSQTAPFNYIAGFTDNRNALVLTPEGGVIKKTKKYTTAENTLETTAAVQVLADKSITATVEMVSKGVQYGQRYAKATTPLKKQKIAYKKNWRYMPALRLDSIDVTDDKDAIVCTEKVSAYCDRYAAIAGDRLLFAPNFFNRIQRKVPKNRDRKRPLVIERGFVDTDTYRISLPEAYECKGLPKPKIIHTDFGEYKVSLEMINPKTIRYNRYLRIEDGVYPKEQYEAYRKFISTIKKADQSKIVITLEP